MLLCIQQLYAHIRLCAQCDVVQLDSRWHLTVSLSKVWSEHRQSRHCNNSNKTVTWKPSIWLLNHWAEGTLIKMNAEMLPTKLTLTCQINSTSKQGELGGGNSSPLTSSTRWWHLPPSSDQTVSDNFSSLQVSKGSCWHTAVFVHISIIQRHTHTPTHAHPRVHLVCAPLPPHCFERYMLMKQLLFPGITLITRSK